MVRTRAARAIPAALTIPEGGKTSNGHDVGNSDAGNNGGDSPNGKDDVEG